MRGTCSAGIFLLVASKLCNFVNTVILFILKIRWSSRPKLKLIYS
jgi:hypothetical protein